jgi:hypothetical protein
MTDAEVKVYYAKLKAAKKKKAKPKKKDGVTNIARATITQPKQTPVYHPPVEDTSFLKAQLQRYSQLYPENAPAPAQQQGVRNRQRLFDIVDRERQRYRNRDQESVDAGEPNFDNVSDINSRAGSVASVAPSRLQATSPRPTVAELQEIERRRNDPTFDPIDYLEQSKERQERIRDPAFLRDLRDDQRFGEQTVGSKASPKKKDSPIKKVFRKTPHPTAAAKNTPTVRKTPLVELQLFPDDRLDKVGAKLKIDFPIRTSRDTKIHAIEKAIRTLQLDQDDVDDVIGDGKGNSKDGIYGDQINKIMKVHKQFIGTVAVDQLPILVPHVHKDAPIGFIVNLDKHTQPGSHWVAVYIDPVKDKSVEYFNSYGEAPPLDVLRGLKAIIAKMNPPFYL